MAEKKKPKKGHKLTKKDIEKGKKTKKSDPFFGESNGKALKDIPEVNEIFQNFGETPPSKVEEPSKKEEETIILPPIVETPKEEPKVEKNVTPSVKPEFKRSTKSSFLIGVRSLREKLLGSKVAKTEEEKELRQEVVKVSNRMIVTEGIIESNTDTLTKLAKEDKRVAELLKAFYSKRPEAARTKLVEGKELYKEELKELFDYFKDITGTLDELGINLSASIPQLAKNIQNLIKDERLELPIRRELVSNLVNILKKEDIKTENTKEIEKLSKSQLNFTKDEVEILTSLLDKVSDETKDKKIFGTLNEIATKTGNAALSSKNLLEFEEKKDDTDQTYKEKLSQGLGAVGGGIQSGLLNAVAAQLGFPGLGTIIGGLGSAVSEILPLFKAIGGLSLGKGAIGAIGNVLGSTAEGVAGGLGAGGVSGIAAAAAAAIPLILASGAGALLGNFVSGKLDEITGGKYSSFVGAPGAALYDFLHPNESKPSSKFTSNVKSALQGNKSNIIPTEASTSNQSNISNTLVSGGSVSSGSLPTRGNVQSKTQVLPTANGSVKSEPVALDTESSVLSTLKSKTENEQSAKMADNAGKPVVVNVASPPPPKLPNATIRKSEIGDFGLAITNSSYQD